MELSPQFVDSMTHLYLSPWGIQDLWLQWIDLIINIFHLYMYK